MMVGDILYFSPRIKFADLDVYNTQNLVAALQDRLEGFYLDPASRLLQTGDAFAAGLLCCAAIDFVALCSGDEHPEIWLRKNIPDFDGEEGLAAKFWRSFRDGLVHEGRIKAFGQFSLDFPALLTLVKPALVVNPQLLLDAIRDAFQAYFKKLDVNQTARLVRRLQRYFGPEIEIAKR